MKNKLNTIVDENLKIDISWRKEIWPIHFWNYEKHIEQYEKEQKNVIKYLSKQFNSLDEKGKDKYDWDVDTFIAKKIIMKNLPIIDNNFIYESIDFDKVYKEKPELRWMNQYSSSSLINDFEVEISENAKFDYDYAYFYNRAWKYNVVEYEGVFYKTSLTEDFVKCYTLNDNIFQDITHDNCFD